MNPLLLIKPLLGLGGGLLNNPVAKLITEKTVGAISHKLEKDKIIKAKPPQDQSNHLFSVK